MTDTNAKQATDTADAGRMTKDAAIRYTRRELQNVLDELANGGLCPAEDDIRAVLLATMNASGDDSQLSPDNDDENPFRRTADGRRATPLPLPSPMSADVLDSLLPPISKLRGKPSPPPMQTVIKGGWRFDVAPREDRTDTVQSGKVALYMAQVHHEHGTETHLARSEAGALEQVAEFCRLNWEGDRMGEQPPGDDDAATVKAYFDNAPEFPEGAESYDITPVMESDIAR